MSYEQRINAVKQWMKDEILTRFTPPSGVDPKLVLGDIIEAVNSNLPVTNDFDSLLAKVTKSVVRNSRSRTLPTVKDFMAACADASKSHGEPHTEATHVSWVQGDLKRVERLVRERRAISDYYLKPDQIRKLIDNTSLTMVDLQPYIDAYKQQQIATYGEKQCNEQDSSAEAIPSRSFKESGTNSGWKKLDAPNQRI